MPRNGSSEVGNRRWMRAGLAVVALFVLAACAGDGRLANPFDRRLTWFDHISGGDIARGCADGSVAPGTYRFVEFRDRAKQVRLYDLTPEPEGRGAELHAHVLEGPIRVKGWAVTEEPLGPWQGRTATRSLPAETLARIAADADEGGLRDPAPVGRVLASRSYFWLASACLADGRFAFQVWEWPDAGYRDRDFARLLHEADPTGIPLNPAPAEATRRVNSILPKEQERLTDRSSFEHYDLIVREAGVEIGRSYPARSGPE